MKDLRYVRYLLRNIMCDFENTVGSSSLGVNNPLRDSFAVKFGQFINQSEILEKDRPSWPSSHRVLIVINGRAIAGGQSRFLHFCLTLYD